MDTISLYIKSPKPITAERVIQPRTLYAGYGALYNWYAVNTGKLAPVGWHIILYTELGNLAILLDPDGTYLNNDAGGYLKSIIENDWDSPNTGASDIYGLNIKGSGMRGYAGPFAMKKQITGFWLLYNTGVPGDQLYAELDYNNSILKTAFYNMGVGGSWIMDKRCGINARAIKDTTSLSIGQTGTVKDIDNNVYPTICMPDGKEWMAANLKTTKLNDGILIPEVKEDATWSILITPGYCWYNNIAA